MATRQKELDITFKVIYPDSKPGKYGSAEQPSPYVDLSDERRALAGMQGADDVVLPGKARVKVCIDYKVDRAHELELRADDPQVGFRRAELAAKVADAYHRAIDEELGLAPAPRNRRASAQDYRRWGNNMDPIVLHTITYDEAKNMCWLGIDS